MENRYWLQFECMVMDKADEDKINNAKDLQRLSEEYHNHIEMAMQDFAQDNGFGDDYDPLY